MQAPRKQPAAWASALNFIALPKKQATSGAGTPPEATELGPRMARLSPLALSIKSKAPCNAADAAPQRCALVIQFAIRHDLSDKHDVLRDVDRAVEGDGLANQPVCRSHLVLTGAEARETGALGERAVALEPQQVAHTGIVAVEVVDDVALRLAGHEGEGVVAAEAGELV